MRPRSRLLPLLLLALTLPFQPAVAADELVLYGAGSLKAVMTELTAAFTAKTGVAVRTAFGPSGLLRERIEKGETVDLFTSADIGNPATLARDGRSGPVVMFTRNALCGWARGDVGMTTETFLDRLLDPAVRIGTSTPKADPGGDYTWAMFERAEGLHPGAFAALDVKAQKIVGNSTAAPAPGAPDPILAAFRDGSINVMIAYCTSARLYQRDIPDLRIVELPATLRVGPEYGLTVVKGAQPAAANLALFILAPEGQSLLAKYGFLPVTLPERQN